MNLKNGLLLLSMFVICGCSTIGPVVTNISPDGTGNVYVEKCNIHTNFFWGYQHMKDCNSQMVKVK